jgi:hypothetical protein
VSCSGTGKSYHEQHHGRFPADRVPRRGEDATRIRESAARLTDRTREAGWSHEQGLAAVLSREVAAREAHATSSGCNGNHSPSGCPGLRTKGRERGVPGDNRHLSGGEVPINAPDVEAAVAAEAPEPRPFEVSSGKSQY